MRYFILIVTGCWLLLGVGVGVQAQERDPYETFRTKVNSIAQDGPSTLRMEFNIDLTKSSDRFNLKEVNILRRGKVDLEIPLADLNGKTMGLTAGRQVLLWDVSKQFNRFQLTDQDVIELTYEFDAPTQVAIKRANSSYEQQRELAQARQRAEAERRREERQKIEAQRQKRNQRAEAKRNRKKRRNAMNMARLTIGGSQFTPEAPIDAQIQDLRIPYGLKASLEIQKSFFLIEGGGRLMYSSYDNREQDSLFSYGYFGSLSLTIPNKVLMPSVGIGYDFTKLQARTPLGRFDIGLPNQGWYARAGATLHFGKKFGIYAEYSQSLNADQYAWQRIDAGVKFRALDGAKVVGVVVLTGLAILLGS
ncbi:hypothetical protein [Pontibacter sp. G13]|uniref:hypothetical protein n=1 Tax=Pontibacter sp. G13 TaxID=3074898 RepID=UPI00288BF97B|nr:hypothetical protein [Pontibacter sp. G13]WNJ19247.1 hypothetical protein RJD25_02045 [Pontibacter sp. G13]